MSTTDSNPYLRFALYIEEIPGKPAMNEAFDAREMQVSGVVEDEPCHC